MPAFELRDGLVQGGERALPELRKRTRNEPVLLNQLARGLARPSMTHVSVARLARVIVRNMARRS